MQKWIIYILFFFLTIFLFSLFYSLSTPFNLVDFITIAIVLIFIFCNLEQAVYAALVFGIFKDFGSSGILGQTSLLYLISLFTVILLQNTILSSHNRISILILIFSFNIIFWFLFAILKANISFIILQESILLLFINSILTFFVYIIIIWGKNQFKKRFI